MIVVFGAKTYIVQLPLPLSFAVILLLLLKKTVFILGMVKMLRFSINNQKKIDEIRDFYTRLGHIYRI